MATMLLILILLLIAIPIAELYVIVQVAQELGVLNTIALLIVISVVGAWLVKREGLGVLMRVQGQLAEGRTPTKDLVDGFILIVAGALMFAPGFLSDVVGILLILPPTRAVVRRLVLRSFRKRVASGQMGVWSNSRMWSGGYVDVEGRDRPGDAPRDPRDPRGRLDP
jgi:UPF0716 protein FxsA